MKRFSICGVALVASLCLGGAFAGTSGAATVKLGQQVSEGGLFQLPTTARAAAKAVITEANKKGVGKSKSKLELETINDNADVGQTVASTNKLISDGVVATVGDASIFNCLANNKIREGAKLYGIGLGIQGPCFSTAVFASVGDPVPTILANAALFMGKKFGKSTVCMLSINLPGSAANTNRALLMLSRIGFKFKYVNASISAGDDPGPALIKAANEGCKSIVLTGTTGMAKQAFDANVRNKLKLAINSATGTYNLAFAKGVGSNANGTYATTQWDVFHQKNKDNKEFLALAKKYHFAADEFSAQAYISAKLIVKALNTIKGPITRASAAAAIKKLNTTVPMFNGKFRFGNQGAHAPNYSTRTVQLNNGKFKTVGGFQTLPAKLRPLGTNFAG